MGLRDFSPAFGGIRMTKGMRIMKKQAPIGFWGSEIDEEKGIAVKTE